MTRDRRLREALAITKAEYDALDLRCPLTDLAIGGTTQRRRQVSAELSELVTERVGFTPARRISKQGESK